MRFGVCCDLADARLVLDLGYDYIEVGASAIATAPDIRPYEGWPIETTNLFFPAGFSLFGPHAGDYCEYGDLAICRAQELGVQLMVIGSGAARRSAPGASPEAAEALFVQVVADLQEIASGYGISIAPESLNRSETNVGNDLGRLAHALHQKGLPFTADLYHILYEADADGKEPDMWAQVPYCPMHVHLADLPRYAPDPTDPAVVSFAGRLRELSYDRRVSLECRQRPSETKEQSYALGLTAMRRLFL